MQSKNNYLSDTSSLVFVDDFKTWKFLSQRFLFKKNIGPDQDWNDLVSLIQIGSVLAFNNTLL